MTTVGGKTLPELVRGYFLALETWHAMDQCRFPQSELLEAQWQVELYEAALKKAVEEPEDFDESKTQEYLPMLKENV